MASIDCERCGAKHESTGAPDSKPPVVCRDCGTKLRALEVDADVEPETTRRLSEADSEDAATPAAASEVTTEAETPEPATTVAASNDETPLAAEAAPAETTADASDAIETPLVAETSEPSETPPLSLEPLSLEPLSLEPSALEASESAPDSTVPIESQDFVEPAAAQERKAPRPPLKARVDTPSELVLADPFSTVSEPAVPRAPAPPSAPSEAPVARTARPQADRRGTSQRAVGALLIGLGGLLAFNLVQKRQQDANEAAVTPPEVHPAKAAATVPLAPPETVPASAPLAPIDATPETVPAAAPLAPVAPPQEAPASKSPSANTPPRVNPAALPTAATADAAFDRSALESALGSAAEQARSCRRGTDPSGTAVVTITFAPSGRATTANVSGPPFAGTDTGGCIAAAMRSARVPAFSGDFVTVKKTIVVQ